MPTTLETLGHWALTNGLHILLVVIFTIAATGAIRWPTSSAYHWDRWWRLRR